jgi:ureidoglycolate amidohydrolase
MLNVDLERLMAQLERLATFSDAPPPAVTRVLYTESDLKARAYLKALIAEAGLKVREDALGNLYARWEGENPALPAVATGSHIDAIPHSGRYDGVVGVLGGLEAVRALKASDFRPKRSLELILFTAEEPTRFGIGCLGSRAMAGTLSPNEIRALKDDEGKNPEEAAREAGFSGELEGVRLEPGSYRAFVELHIEQGPILEEKRVPIGVVTAIAAPATLHVTLQGEGGHAGAVLMEVRRDALVAASEIALAVEAAAKGSGSPDTVATVGVLDVHPRAVNSIPSRVFMTIDARDTDLARRDHAVDEIKRAIQEITRRRKIKAIVETLNADPPVACDPGIIEAIETAAAELEVKPLPMVSRAYHDALFMARIVPVGMIFIPSKGGVSHRPDEYSAPQDIGRGVEVLARALARLSS